MADGTFFRGDLSVTDTAVAEAIAREEVRQIAERFPIYPAELGT